MRGSTRSIFGDGDHATIRWHMNSGSRQRPRSAALSGSQPKARLCREILVVFSYQAPRLPGKSSSPTTPRIIMWIASAEGVLAKIATMERSVGGTTLGRPFIGHTESSRFDAGPARSYNEPPSPRNSRPRVDDRSPWPRMLVSKLKPTIPSLR